MSIFLRTSTRVIAALFLAVWLPRAAAALDDAAGSQTATTSAATPSARDLLHNLSEGVERITLSNGLRVLLFRRSQAPIFTGHIWVKVGGVNEVPGITGAAHLLEHMAFKGSTTIGTKDYERERVLLEKLEALIDKRNDGAQTALAEEIDGVQKELEALWKANEFSQIYEKRGAVGLNAATGKDYTYYMVSLPSAAFELWCWMESDRLVNPVFRQFYKEREVVREERRMRTDDNPSGKLYEALLATAYWTHPNRLPVIGWPSDLATLRTKDIEDFYKKYYRPDNMVISLVGDLDAAAVEPILERYFGRLARPEEALPELDIKEEKQEGERRSTVYFDAEPRFALAFHKPVFPHPDDLQFTVLHGLLSDGRSSPLYRELVQQKHVATSVSTSEAPGELYPSLFYVWGVPAKGISNDQLLAEVGEVLEGLKTTPVSEADLEAAKKRVRVDLISSMASNSGLARTLGHAELLWGDWEVLFQMYDIVLKTTAEDIRRLAQTYFTAENRTVVFLEKREQKKEGEVPQ